MSHRVVVTSTRLSLSERKQVDAATERRCAELPDFHVTTSAMLRTLLRLGLDAFARGAR